MFRDILKNIKKKIYFISKILFIKLVLKIFNNITRDIRSTKIDRIKLLILLALINITKYYMIFFLYINVIFYYISLYPKLYLYILIKL